MKNLLFCFIGSMIIGWVFPWWSVFILGIISPLIFGGRSLLVFLSTFAGAFFGWFLLAWLMDFRNESILSGRMAEMFELPSGIYLLILSSIIGGLCCGIGGILGAFMKMDYFTKAHTEG